MCIIKKIICFLLILISTIVMIGCEPQPSEEELASRIVPFGGGDFVEDGVYFNMSSKALTRLIGQPIGLNENNAKLLQRDDVITEGFLYGLSKNQFADSKNIFTEYVFVEDELINIRYGFETEDGQVGQLAETLENMISDYYGETDLLTIEEETYEVHIMWEFEDIFIDMRIDTIHNANLYFTVEHKM